MRALILLLAAMLAVFVAGGAAARSPVLVLHDGDPPAGLAGHVDVLRDPTRALTAEAVATAAGFSPSEFSPLSRAKPEFGNTTDRIWLRADLRNETDIREWVLDFNQNFIESLSVRLLRPGGAELVMDIGPDDPFQARPTGTPRLSAAFVLPPGETVTLLVGYTADGSSALDLNLSPRVDYERARAATLAKDFGYFGMMVLLALLGLIAFGVTRQVSFAAYAAFALAMLLYVMHRDGYTFQYLWPHAPRFNADGTIVLGSAVIITGVTYARAFLRTPRLHPAMDRWLFAVLLAAVALLASWAVLDAWTVKRLLVLVSFLGPVMFLVAGINAARTRPREVRFFLVGSVLFILSSALMASTNWLGVYVPRSVTLDSIRIVTVVDAIMLGLAILDRYIQARRTEERALRHSMQAMEETLALQRRLARLESDHAALEEEARRGSHRLAEAAHDLRQPIHALRLSIRGLMSGAARDRTVAERVESSFSYLEGLIAGALEDSRRAVRAPADDATAGQVLEALGRMFEMDAQAKGLDFRVVPGTAPLGAEPTVVLRILANLVSNAIRYTDAGRVLVGVRRRAGALRFEVHDTGPGMDAAAFALAAGRSVRLDPGGAAEGTGLGLAIACAEAKAAGMTLALLPRAGGGTSIALGLPAGDGAAGSPPEATQAVAGKAAGV